ncbi:MAG: T9SS type A sorting domain-containing protein, partial [Bacteroidia bacterium]|nr:T9SS type A sorting domain-containing protein [Bacteroidia bacterium]
SSDGTIYALANGGTAPYTYQWSSGHNSSIVSSLSVGTYMLTVSDNNGCIVTKSVTLTEPEVLTCLTNSLTDVSCNGGSDGSISIGVSGGNGPYESVWNTSPVTYGGNLSNMPAGSYTLSVTDTNGCVDVQTYQIDEPEALFVYSKKTNVSCNRGSDGTIDLRVSKGTPPYTYLWNNGTTTEDRVNLKRGYYTVTVTDANGCIKVHTKFINHPKRLKPVRSVSHVSCYNGSDGAIDLSIVGGTMPYSYTWSDGATLEDRSNLSKGWYGFTVTDANGCTVNRNIKVNQSKFIYLTTIPQDVTTPGGSDGAITTTVSGGAAPYTYLWSNGSTLSSISGLTAGNYSLTLTDAKGCVKYRNPVVNEPIASGPLSCNTIGSTITCGTNTGTASVTATGGFPPYSYFWNTNPGQSTQTATGLAPGTYLVQVTDNRGASSAVFCFATISCSNAKTTSISNEGETLLSVYPNPFDNEINLNVLSVFDDETFEVQVIDILGKTHHYSIMNTTRGINTHKLKLVNLPAGIYFVKLKSNTSSFTERLIKH